RAVVQRGELGLVRQLGRDRRLERSLHVGVGERVGGDRRFAAAAKRLPRGAVRGTRRQLARCLEYRERARKIRPRFAVDLAPRDALPIEQHLKTDEVAAWQSGTR